MVRLKAGDPMIFGRAGEEIAAAEARGIPVEVVPGISAAQGAAAALKLSLTHRDHARRLQYVTAHGRDGRLPRDLSWPALTDPAASTIVYMPGATWHELAAASSPRACRGNACHRRRECHAAGRGPHRRATVADLAGRLAARAWTGPCSSSTDAFVRAAGHEAATGALASLPQPVLSAPAAAFP